MIIYLAEHKWKGVMLQKVGLFLLGVLTLILFSALGIAMGILAVLAWIRLESTDRKCGEWVECPSDQELNTLRNTIVESECKTADDSSTNDLNYSPYAKPRYPPQNESAPRECVISLEYYPTGEETLTYYVLLDNGKIWKWIHKSPAMQYLGHLVIGVLVGLVIGIIWFRFEILKSNRAEPPKSQIQQSSISPIVFSKSKVSPRIYANLRKWFIN